MKKRELNKLVKSISAKKRQVFGELLEAAGKPGALDNVEELEKALDKADRAEVALNRVRATADHALSQYFKQKLMAGLVRGGAKDDNK